METTDLLKHLISFPTISSESNLDFIYYVKGLFDDNGITSHLVKNSEGNKAALLAHIGPLDKAGILLSGHSDVVPVEGQNWDSEPFVAQEKDNKIFGRGSSDMKGFLACAIQTLIYFSDKQLIRPLFLAISFDEELGCLGVKDLLLHIKQLNVEPYLCIVGEPTEMKISTGHKGKTSYRVHCQGDEAHSSQAPVHTNAIYLACDVINRLRDLQPKFIEQGIKDNDYDIPYSTVHVGTIEGGRSLNIVPGHCQFEFEIRHLPGDDIKLHMKMIFEQAAALITSAKNSIADTQANIRFEQLTDYPGLASQTNHDAINTLLSLSDNNRQLIKVAFGTEGGLFSEYLNAPVVVCGPGSIDQAHKANEYIEIDQLQHCEKSLTLITDYICVN